VNIQILVLGELFDVLILKIAHHHVGSGDYKIGQQKRHDRKQKSRKHVWIKKSVETNTAAENSYNLGVHGQLGGKKDDGNKRKKIAEHVDEAGNKNHVILENDFSDGSFVFDEVIDFLGDVEDDDNDRKQSNGVKESSQKLLDDVDVKNLKSHRASFIRKITELKSVPLEAHRSNTITDAS
jgi:hypothetical protein